MKDGSVASGGVAGKRGVGKRGTLKKKKTVAGGHILYFLRPPKGGREILKKRAEPFHRDVDKSGRTGGQRSILHQSGGEKNQKQQTGCRSRTIMP